MLPGPGVAVMVPMAGSGGGKARGRARKAAAYQEFDLCPAAGTFTLPGSDEAADPLTALCKVCVCLYVCACPLPARVPEMIWCNQADTYTHTQRSSAHPLGHPLAHRIGALSSIR